MSIETKKEEGLCLLIDSREPVEIYEQCRSFFGTLNQTEKEVTMSSTMTTTTTYQSLLKRVPIPNEWEIGSKRWKKTFDEQHISLHISREVLPLGDFHIYWKGELKVLIERKEGQDFWKSVFDGRIQQQSIRMAQFCQEHPDVHCFWFLPEVETWNHQQEDSTWKWLGRHCLERGPREHVFYFSKTINMYHALGSLLYTSIPREKEEKTFTVSSEIQNTLAMMKPKRHYQQQSEYALIQTLCIIPGISKKTAELLFQQLSSLILNQNNDDEDDEDEEKKILSVSQFCNWMMTQYSSKEEVMEIVAKLPLGSKRTVGKKMAQQIYTFFHFPSSL